ncbi:MAG: hypothetical protein HZB50_14360 [Chloroflexi bacterium]|nr:hypothetical protein [Chloroflexota bacterium]
METVDFMGHECVALENETIRLLLSRSMGPRILSLSLGGGENLLAELPDFVTEHPGVGIFHFYGGHRLWHAPEEINRTYLPDDAPVNISSIEGGYLMTQDVEIKTGLQKSIEVCLEKNSSRVVITHRLHNRGFWDVTCAPWAITQLKVGGIAILPQACQKTGVLPNRSLALWDYTNISNPNVILGRNYIMLNARSQEPFKVGFPNPRGWLAYWLNDTLFVKRAKYAAQSAYYDFGSSSECYCNGQFLELETLGPIQTIAPNESIPHVETWELYGNVTRPRDEQDVQALVASLKLE